MSNALMRLAARIARVEREVRRLGASPQLAYSSLEDGAIEEYDDQGTLVQIIGRQFDGTHVAASVNGPNPPTPSPPVVESAPGGLRIVWDGFWDDPAALAPMDLLRIDVVVSDVPGFDPLTTAAQSSIQSPRGGEVFLVLPEVAQYAALVARSMSGKASVPTALVSATPGPAGGAGGIQTFHTNTAPVGLGEDDDGALWFDTDNGNRQYRWDGTLLLWTALPIGSGGLEDVFGVANRFVVGDPVGQRIELNSVGIEAYNVDNIGTMKLSPGADDFLELTNELGDVVAAINAAGMASFEELDVRGTLLLTPGKVFLDGEQLSTLLESFSRGVMAWGTRTPDVLGVLTEYAVLQIDVFIPTGRHCLMVLKGQMYTPSGDTTGVLRTRYTYDPDVKPAAPTNTSTLHRDLYHHIARPNSSTSFTFASRTSLAAGYWRFRVTLAKGGGTAPNINVNGTWEFILLDMGPWADIDSDNQAYKPGSPGTLDTGGSDSGPDPTPETKKYTKTYDSTWSQTYNGGGSQISGGDVTQGFYSGTNGNQRGLIGFPDVQIGRDLAGSTVTKVELYLYADHWHNGSGGTAVIGFHDHAGKPTTFSGNTDIIRSTNWPRNKGRWVDLTSQSPDGWRTGGKKGIVIGPGPTTGSIYYGSFRGANQSAPPKLRITYKK